MSRINLHFRQRYSVFVFPVLIAGIAGLIAGCVTRPDRQTLSELQRIEPDLAEVEIDDGIEQAMVGYRKFLEEAPESALTPEAMRRLADLQLEKRYGILDSPRVPNENRSTEDAERLEAPQRATLDQKGKNRPQRTEARNNESDSDFENRVAGETRKVLINSGDELALPTGETFTGSGPREAIELYDRILKTYPNYAHNDRVLYQKARAYDELGEVEKAIEVAALLVERYPESSHLDEIQFRRAEYFFTRKKYFPAEEAYAAIVQIGKESAYFELALYKLGWTLYKQMMLEEALEQYVRLLDHKVGTGYDFDQKDDEAVAQRISDTYRVMSLCFSELGGAHAVESFFAKKGQRDYEDLVYRHLGDFYLEKLRYSDAAKTLEAFVELYPFHRTAPHFSMRVVEVYEAGDFPKLVLESKKDFADRYGLESAYWTHFQPEDSTQVLNFLKGNLKDLANHYHALYQNAEEESEKPNYFAESTRWYQGFLTSFPEDPETPGIHYRFADLFLENEDFSEAALTYEKVAYEYPEHDKNSAAGYAAIFSYRQLQKSPIEAEQTDVRRTVVASTFRFVEAFPKHEQAAPVLGAAIDDLYTLKNYAKTIETGRKLLAEYPEADVAIRRDAWTAMAHAAFDLEDFGEAEKSYAEVLLITKPDSESYDGIMNNLAASIYKQGERARSNDDFKIAADHFLRVATAAPLSSIRPVAEYDASAALIALKEWDRAAQILDQFRQTFPEHELHRQATQQMAFVYREAGELSRAADEYLRVAEEADTPDLRGEALLVAGELYEDADQPNRAIEAYRDYVTSFTDPIEQAVVTRFKMAEIFTQLGDVESQRAQLGEIVRIDGDAAGADRTPVIRLTAGRSALLLAETAYADFRAIQLVQPFDQSLTKKQSSMKSSIDEFSKLIDYEVGEVTAAATYYMAEVYGEFSRALVESERPLDLTAAELQDYEDVLEEEAYPYEERAIDVHEKNLDLMATGGIWNEWVEKSLGRLASLMPGRYAKTEISTGPIHSIEVYAYVSPAKPQPLIPTPAELTESAPQLDSSNATTGLISNEEEPSGSVPAAPAPTIGGEKSAEQNLETITEGKKDVDDN